MEQAADMNSCLPPVLPCSWNRLSAGESRKAEGIKYAAPTAAADEDELPTEQPSEAYRDLAEYWAPTMYQDVNTIYLTRSDIPTPFSCDGDWNGGSNRCYVL